ncbi:transcriptional regulator, AraC family [Shewanella psychrophila]|uniref:Transcriptional regulator, AraC family n=1 Tax=Shewanella psychrophila TaxID=225848 RepID=A0A1S6HY25_9GAMM|nr:helix-turn-helix transcriptional regulator [Shewanella psychrophila]AQS40334.1 transcriptional regulator, AraC family [Shewanella psychrophila]
MANICHSKLLSQPAANVFLSYELFLPDTITPPHQHIWGQLQIVNTGVIEIKTEKNTYLSPSQYGIWVPANTRHESYMRRRIQYSSINIVPEIIPMPDHVCLIEISAIFRSILDDFRSRNITQANTTQDDRLITVVLDQIRTSKQQPNFLPQTNDPLLTPILLELGHEPSNQMNLSEWAQKLHTTERTLARHCRNKLGMNFSELRQRAKFLRSVELLRQGYTVKNIALSLGYNQSSPFITLFKKYAGSPPAQHIKNLTKI